MIYFAHRILGTQHYKETEVARINSMAVDDDQKKIMVNRVIDESGTFKVLQRCAAITAGGSYLLLHAYGQLMYSMAQSPEGIKKWFTFITENNEVLGWVAVAAFGMYLGGGVKGFLSNAINKK